MTGPTSSTSVGSRPVPGDEVSLDEELERVVPAVAALNDRFDLPISVDTWRAEVLRQCIEVGAVIGNDISGFADPDYLPVAAAGQASVVATHIRLAPRVPDPDPVYDDLVGDVRAFLADRAQWALDAGIPPERIVIDAGLDLGKTRQMSWELLHRSDELASLGFPLLLSASNKRFLFELLETERHDIASGTTAAHAIGIAKGLPHPAGPRRHRGPPGGRSDGRDPGRPGPASTEPGGELTMAVVFIKGDDEALMAQAVRAAVDDLVGDGDRSLMVEEVTEERFTEPDEADPGPPDHRSPDPTLPDRAPGRGRPATSPCSRRLQPSCP